MKCFDFIVDEGGLLVATDREKKAISVKFDVRLLDRLDKVANAAGISRTALLHVIVSDFLASQNKE